MANEVFEVGPHTITIEDEGIMHVRWRGLNELDHCIEIMRIGLLAQERFGNVYVVMNLEEATDATHEARRHMIKYSDQRPFLGIAYVGGPFKIRVMVNLVSRAWNLVRAEQHPVKTVDNEAEARAWIEELRLKKSA